MKFLPRPLIVCTSKALRNLATSVSKYMHNAKSVSNLTSKYSTENMVNVLIVKCQHAEALIVLIHGKLPTNNKCKIY